MTFARNIRRTALIVRYHFNGFTLDIARGCLHGPDAEVELRPKSFDMLRCLVENAGRLISKEELVSTLWQRAIVTDESLARCISDVRTAIADFDHEIIRTVPRRGYLFTAAVSCFDTTERLLTLSGLEAAPSRAATDLPSIAVLAFTNMSGDSRQEYLCDGLTEDIITELSRFADLLVIARNSSFQYKGKSVDVRRVGRELGVRYVLEGSIRQTRNRIRISAQLVDAVTGVHCWAERYDRKLDDVFTVQDEVARTIVAVLAVHMNKVETERVLATPPATWQAYQHYLRAAEILVLYHSSFNIEDLFRGRRGLIAALAIDPAYARAHAALSLTYISQWAHRWDGDCPWSAALNHAYQSAKDAVRFAPNLPDAHVALGWALTWRCQYSAAIAEFERATVLNPNLTNFRFAHTLLVAGELARAVQVLQMHMRLDPFYQPHAPGYLGFAYYLLKQYAEALPHLQECVSRAPTLAQSRHWLAATYAQLGQFDRARSEAAEGLSIQPWYTISQALYARLCKRPEDSEHFKDGLRKAGYPE